MEALKAIWDCIAILGVFLGRIMLLVGEWFAGAPIWVQVLVPLALVGLWRYFRREEVGHCREDVDGGFEPQHPGIVRGRGMQD